MKRMLVLASAVVLSLVASGVLLAQENPFLGTWKLNVAKSHHLKNVSGAEVTSYTSVWEAVGDNVKVTQDITYTEGKPRHIEWLGKFDGKDYPMTGSLTADARSLKKINGHTLEFANKKDGKVTETGRVVVSADGKSGTTTGSATDSKGHKYRITEVFDKQ